MTSLLRLNLVLLVVASLFDPSDLLVRAKVPLFILLWIITLIDLAISNRCQYPVPTKLYFYTLLFVLFLPAIGMFVYILRGGGIEGYEGFRYLKSYFFLSLCIPLAIKRIDLLRPLSLILSLLSVAIILICVITINDDSLRGQLAIFGDAFTIFSLTDRSYGNLSYESVYFHASPLLVLAIVYFCHRYLYSEGGTRLLSLFLLVLNVAAMALSGTRNNMIVAICAPLMVIAWYRTGRTRFLIGCFIVLILIIGITSGVAQAMLSSDEYSNSIKLGHFGDYVTLFSDWRTLLFGQGLGASFFSTVWGTRTTITELSYLEIIRIYGLIFSPLLFALIFYPLRELRNKETRDHHYLFIGYACYLYLCTANPLLLSSTGMLALSVVLYRTFCKYNLVPRRANAATIG